MTVLARLTDLQLDLLRFFGGQRDPPHRVTRCWYDALEAQGLIELEPQRSRYRITELGESVLRRWKE